MTLNHVYIRLLYLNYKFHHIIKENQGKAFNLMSSKLLDMAYKSEGSDNLILHIELEKLQNSIMSDTHGVGSSDGIRPDQGISDFIKNYSLIQRTIGVEYELADRDSKNIINGELKGFILSTKKLL